MIGLHISDDDDGGGGDDKNINNLCLLIGSPQPPPQKLLPEHAQTLERYAWESFDSHSQGELTSVSDGEGGSSGWMVRSKHQTGWVQTAVKAVRAAETWLVLPCPPTRTCALQQTGNRTCALQQTGNCLYIICIA